MTLASLGELLGVHFTTIGKWETRGVPAEQARWVEEKTGISRYELCPEVFGPAPEQTSAHAANGAE